MRCTVNVAKYCSNGQAVFNEEYNGILCHFRSGVYDDVLKQATVDQPNPIAIETLPEFKIIVQRMENELKMKALERRKDVARQVEASSFQAICQDLNDDMASLEKCFAEVARVQAEWTPRVCAYKRARRNRGIEAVKEIMQKRLRVVEVDEKQGFLDTPRAFNSWKADSTNDDVPHMADNTCMPQRGSNVD